MFQRDLPGESLTAAVNVLHLDACQFKTQQLPDWRAAPPFLQGKNDSVDLFAGNDLLHIRGSTNNSWVNQRFPNVHPLLVQKSDYLHVVFRMFKNVPDERYSRIACSQYQDPLVSAGEWPRGVCQKS